MIFYDMRSELTRDLDNEYMFDCLLCGDCCTGEMKIRLNLYDLYKICRVEGLNSSHLLFEKGLILMDEGQNGLPLPVIKFKPDPFRFCPYLINDMDEDNRLKGLCSLHPANKPLICKMAPVGRVIDLETGTEGFLLTPPTTCCPGMEQQQCNRLEVLKTELRGEMDFEYRYYQLLEKISQKKITASRLKEGLFYFNAEKSFEVIMDEKEQLFRD